MRLTSDDFVQSTPPVLDLNRSTKIMVERGARTVNLDSIQATSFSSSNIIFNSINPPSPEIIIDKRIMVRMAARIYLTGTQVPNGQFLLNTSNSDGTGELRGGGDALRAFPLSQAMESCRLTLNTTGFDQNINDFIEPLLRYSNYRDISESNYSTTPSYQDTYQNYNDWVSYGSGKNPLGNYGEQGYNSGRGGFSQLTVVSQNLQGSPAGTPSTGTGDVMLAVVDVEFAEYIMMSPLGFSKQSDRGFYGIHNMTVNIRFDSSAPRLIWSHNNGSANDFKEITNIQWSPNDVTTYQSNPSIYFNYYSLISSVPKPVRNLYEFDHIDYYPRSIGSLSAGQVLNSVSIQNIQLSSIPKRLYIFARERKADRLVTSTDTYAVINKLSLTFNNASGYFSKCDEIQLYENSVRNGLKMTYSQYTKFVGSVFSVNFVDQIALSDEDFIGKKGTYQLSGNISLRNPSDRTINYDLLIVVISNGVLIIDNEQVYQDESIGNLINIDSLRMVPQVEYEFVDSFYGGGFKTVLKKVGKAAKKGLEMAAPHIKEAVKKYGPSATNLLLSEIPGIGPELGQVSEELMKKLLGGRISRAEYNRQIDELLKGGRIVEGGRMASKKQLKRM